MTQARVHTPPLNRSLAFAMALTCCMTSAFANAAAECEPGRDAKSRADAEGDSTIKLVTLLRRKEGMSMAAFKEYYESVHARIGEKYLSPHASRYFRRYLHPVPGPDAARQAEARTYDVVMEIWFPDQNAFDAAFRDLSTAEAQAEIVADELKLFNRDYIHSYIVDEHESCL